jgi:hypothetical protein
VDAKFDDQGTKHLFSLKKKKKKKKKKRVEIILRFAA